MTLPATGETGLYRRDHTLDHPYNWILVDWWPAGTERGEIEERRIGVSERGMDTAIVDSPTGYLPNYVDDPMHVDIDAHVTLFTKHP